MIDAFCFDRNRMVTFKKEGTKLKDVGRFNRLQPVKETSLPDEDQRQAAEALRERVNELTNTVDETALIRLLSDLEAVRIAFADDLVRGVDTQKREMYVLSLQRAMQRLRTTMLPPQSAVQEEVSA